MRVAQWSNVKRNLTTMGKKEMKGWKVVQLVELGNIGGDQALIKLEWWSTVGQRGKMELLESAT